MTNETDSPSVVGRLPLAGDNTTMTYRNGKFYIYSGYSPNTGKLTTQTWVSRDLGNSWNKKKKTMTPPDNLSRGYAIGETNVTEDIGDWFIFKDTPESIDAYGIKKPGELIPCGPKPEFKNGATLVRENGKIYTMTYFFRLAVILAVDYLIPEAEWKVVNIIPIDEVIEDAMMVVNSESNTMTLLGGVKHSEGASNVPNFDITEFPLANALYE